VTRHQSAGLICYHIAWISSLLSLSSCDRYRLPACLYCC
jgi:hypothetical protein